MNDVNFKNQDGFALLLVLVLMVLTTISVVAISKMVFYNNVSSIYNYQLLTAKVNCESGNRHAVSYLQYNALEASAIFDTYLKYGKPVKLPTVNNINDGEYDVYLTALSYGDFSGESPNDTIDPDGRTVKNVAICHIPAGDTSFAQTIYVASPSVIHHEGHGDPLRSCMELFTENFYYKTRYYGTSDIYIKLTTEATGKGNSKCQHSSVYKLGNISYNQLTYTDEYEINIETPEEVDNTRFMNLSPQLNLRFKGLNTMTNLDLNDYVYAEPIITLTNTDIIYIPKSTYFDFESALKDLKKEPLINFPYSDDCELIYPTVSIEDEDYAFFTRIGVSCDYDSETYNGYIDTRVVIGEKGFVLESYIDEYIKNPNRPLTPRNQVW